VHALAALGEDEAICQILERLELLFGEFLKHFADDLFTPTFDLLCFVDRVGQLLGDLPLTMPWTSAFRNAKLWSDIGKPSYRRREIESFMS
jgi:hypothetical protein